MPILKKINETRVAFLLCVLFFGFGLVHAVQNFRHPYAVPVAFSDHFSHVSSVIHFWSKGLSVYSKAPEEALERPSAQPRNPKFVFFANMGGLSYKDLFVNPLRADGPPLALNWPSQVCPYPLGMHLLFAPFALSFQCEWTSFSTMNRAIVIFLLLATALAQFEVLRTLFDLWRGGGGKLALVFYTLCSIYLCFAFSRWALRGMYDSIYIGLLLSGFSAHEKKAPLRSIFLFSLAAFLHWRTLYSLPLLYVQFRSLEVSHFRQWKLWMSAVLLAVSFFCLFLAFPHLRAFAVTNRLYSPNSFPGDATIICALLTVHTILLLWMRDYLSVAFAFCYFILLALTPQVWGWHFLAVMPLVLFTLRRAATRSSKVNTLVSISTMLLFGWVAYNIYGFI